MKWFPAVIVPVLVLFLSRPVPAQTTIVPCSVCQPAVADTWPHNTGKYGAGTRNFYLHNYWHKDLTVHANGNGNGSGWTNLTFTLKMGHDTILQIPNQWGSARIWGYWDPAYSNGPFTLAEINMDSRTAANWHLDWYDVSLVDGYNLPMLFYPLPGTFYHDSLALDQAVGRQGWTCGGQGDCVADLYLTAPASMLKLAANGDTNGIYCQDNAQCRTLKKTACPTSYSWPFDDPTSLFTCPSPNLPASLGDYAKYGPDYILDFGLPPSSPVINNNKPTINYTFIDALAVTMTRRGELKYTYGGMPNARLSLCSCNGKVMCEIPLTESSGTVRVPALARGMYFVTLTTDRSVKTARMMAVR
jgi:hypothetical protein